MLGILESEKFWLVESETWEKFFWWNPKSWALESGIQLKESGTPLTIGIRTPSSSNKDQNPVPGIRISPRRGIQNPRLCWILLHRTIVWTGRPKPLWRAVLKKQIRWFRDAQECIKVAIFWQDWACKVCRFSVLFGYLTK